MGRLQNIDGFIFKNSVFRVDNFQGLTDMTLLSTVVERQQKFLPIGELDVDGPMVAGR